jgi:hypothetical protein
MSVFSMLRADCLDNTPQEVLDCEQERPAGQKNLIEKQNTCSKLIAIASILTKNKELC